MKKGFAGILLSAFLLTSAALWAADFWEKKKFVDWSEKEVTKILTKSPWARRVDVRLVSLLDSPPGMGPAHGGGFGGPREGSGPSSTVITCPPTCLAPGEGVGNSGPSAGGFPARFRLTVRWYSALPVRQAIVKVRFGGAAETSGRAAELLQEDEAHYIIGISSVPIAMLVRHPERAGSASEGLPSIGQRLKALSDQTKSESFLKIKGQQPVAAQAVQIQAGQAGNSVNAQALRSAADVYVVFPRRMGGRELINLEDKKVEFVTLIGPLEVKAKFKLKDMVYKGELEL